MTVPLIGSFVSGAVGGVIGLIVSPFAVPLLIRRDLKKAYEYVLHGPAVVGLIAGVLGLGLSAWVFAGGGSSAQLVLVTWIGLFSLLAYGLMIAMIIVAYVRLPAVWPQLEPALGSAPRLGTDSI